MIIQSKRVWIAGTFVAAQIEMKDGKINNIFNYNEKSVDQDYGNERIVPGFIDVHTHGAYGFDTNYALEDGLKDWVKSLPLEGVTGFCPTTITQGSTVLSDALKNVAHVHAQKPPGAEILGIHFEGPYLDMKYKGAQPPEHIVTGTIEAMEQFQKDANGLIKLITMATEHDPNFELTKYCANNHIAVSIGHSSSTYEQVVMAIANGAKSMTHVYNGMTPFNHRENGMVGAALNLTDFYGEIICDGNHSTIAAVSTFFRSKGDDYCIMISDSLMAKGSPAGTQFQFGGHTIEVYEDGSAHLIEGAKSLAGSTLKINDGLKLLVEQAQVPFATALKSCTINPARLIELGHKKGLIVSGYDADIVVLKDDYSVRQTYCYGIAQI